MTRSLCSLAPSILAVLMLAACGAGSASSPGAAAPGKTATTASSTGGSGDAPEAPPPLASADKREVWKGPRATVYELPSLGVYEVIADGDRDGVEAEYSFIASLQCNGSGQWKSNEQSLITKDGRQYDVLHCVCSAGGPPRDFTFDISQYFGKL